MKNQSTILGLRASAVFEIAGFFIILLLATWLLGTDNRFWDVTPHPCWIIVLLISAQYGIGPGIFATIISCIYLLLGNLPDQGLGEGHYDRLLEILSRPAMWVAAALFVGGIANRHINSRRELADELEQSRERERKIADSYEWVSDGKQKLELQIAGQLSSSMNTYRAAKAIEKLDPRDVMNGVQQLVEAVLNPRKFSLYMLNDQVLENTIASGWEHGEEFARVIGNSTSIYQEVIGNQSVLCVANDQHERLLENQGVLVGPLTDSESGRVIGMLKIEDLGFADFSMSTIESFRSICDWIGASLVNAEKYQVAKDGSIVNPDHNMMTEGYFRRYSDYISALAKRLNFNVGMVVVKLAGADKLSPDAKRAAARKLGTVVDNILRSVDLAFDYQGDAEEYSIILPATDKNGVRIVVDKIEQGLRQAGMANNVRYSFATHMIHEK